VDIAAVEDKRNIELHHDWNDKKLMKRQITYACTDAFVTYKVGEMLQSHLDLHACQSPVPVDGVQLHFVEDEKKMIRVCLACTKRRTHIRG
jgi:hypothetical protein